MEEKPALRSLLEDECIVWPGGRTVIMDGGFVLEEPWSNRLPTRPMSSDDAFEQEGVTMVQLTLSRA